jgi:hypothetical protein
MTKIDIGYQKAVTEYELEYNIELLDKWFMLDNISIQNNEVYLANVFNLTPEEITMLKDGKIKTNLKNMTSAIKKLFVKINTVFKTTYLKYVQTAFISEELIENAKKEIENIDKKKDTIEKVVKSNLAVASYIMNGKDINTKLLEELRDSKLYKEQGLLVKLIEKITQAIGWIKGTNHNKIIIGAKGDSFKYYDIVTNGGKIILKKSVERVDKEADTLIKSSTDIFKKAVDKAMDKEKLKSEIENLSKVLSDIENSIDNGFNTLEDKQLATAMREKYMVASKLALGITNGLVDTQKGIATILKSVV